ncbi:MAG: GcrA family cell cycle regulator, partial [Alphaproteobacteria bacterium]
MTWTAEKIKQLKKLWQKGKSTVEIGRELGISKNAVVGKVHRLELNARPSPIKKETVAKSVKPQKKQIGKVTLLDLKLTSCRWPMGDPEEADFHFCGKNTVTGKPYCAEHCKIAYTSLKELTSQEKAESKKASEPPVKETPKNQNAPQEEKTSAKKQAPQPAIKKDPQKSLATHKEKKSPAPKEGAKKV